MEDCSGKIKVGCISIKSFTVKAFSHFQLKNYNRQLWFAKTLTITPFILKTFLNTLFASINRFINPLRPDSGKCSFILHSERRHAAEY